VVTFFAYCRNRTTLPRLPYQLSNLILKHLNLLVRFYFKVHFNITHLFLFTCCRVLREKPFMYAATQGMQEKLKGKLSVQKRPVLKTCLKPV
jgi:hypothetical protein